MIYVKCLRFEVKRSGVTLKFSRTKVPCTLGDLSLRVLDCIVTISFGVYLVLWLF